MRILVTGHNGYIGSIMVPMLQAAGHEVVGQDSYLYGDDCTFGEGVPDIPALAKDVRDLQTADLEGFDAIIHLAGLSNDPLGDLNPEWTYDINHVATVNLAKMAKDVGVQLFLQSSSCSMYGASGDKMLTEEADFNPVTPYAVSKVRVENDVSRMADESFSPVFLRNATAYGVSPRLRADLVLNNLVGWAYTTGRVLIMSDGTPWRPIVHIEDISRAFLAMLRAPRELVHNQAFNVGITEENYQVRDLAEIVRETVPGCHVEYAEDGGPDPRCYRVDCGKLARTVPDFKPQWNARRGAEELYAAYKRVGLTLEEFQGPRYMRVKHIKDLLNVGSLDGTLRWTDPARSGRPAESYGVPAGD